MTNPQLNEGLRTGDLRGMVQNRLSVDEYESKIDEHAIVLAFYVCEKHAAEDLNRFIQKSYVDLLDTEVSAAPDQKGNYLVFVEMSMNDKTAKGVADLCQDINTLAAIHKWEVSVRGFQATEPIDAKGIEHVLRNTLQAELDEFFSASDLGITLTEGYWFANSTTTSMLFNVVDFGTFEKVVERNKLHECAVDLTPETTRVAKALRTALGSQWSVDRVGDHYAVYNDSSNALLLFTHHPL